MPTPLLRLTDSGFYCEAGQFYIDPWKPVQRAVVTHAHGDHIVWGCESYLVAERGQHVFRSRLGPDAVIETAPYGQQVVINGVRVSFHPAGHILGSAQIRVEYQGEVWVASGDYKVEPDSTCDPFELVPCHHFITESTFGLPIYRWQPQAEIFAQINQWWANNRDQGKASLLYGYALGKAQRMLAGVDPTIGPIYTHGAVERINRDYRASGIALPETQYVASVEKPDWRGALIVAPPSARGTPWTRKFGNVSSAFASGWMRIRGARRQRAVDRGFVLSDHVDWPSLMSTIKATGAEHIYVTHGYTAVVVRWLLEHGVDARGLQTHFSDERSDTGVDIDAEEVQLETDGEEQL